MKRVFYSLVFCMFVMNIHAQLTYEATLPNGYMDIEGAGSQWKRIKPEGADIFIYYREANSIIRYNSSDFSRIETLVVVHDEDHPVIHFQLIPAGLYKNDDEEYFLIWTYDRKLGVYKKVGSNLVLDASLITAIEMACVYGEINESLYFPTYIWSNGLKCFIFVKNENQNIDVYSFAGRISNVSQVKAENKDMRPYPNPSREKIHLTFDAVKEVSSIRICDINGKMVERIPVGSDATEYELDVHSYPEGVYFYEIDGKSQSFMVK